MTINIIYHKVIYYNSPRYFDLKVVEVLREGCVCMYGIWRHKIFLKNSHFLINQHIILYGNLMPLKYRLDINIFHFNNYLISTSVWYTIKYSNYINLGLVNLNNSWLVNYFLYHIKLYSSDIKTLQITNVVALFILSNIHTVYLKKIFKFFKISYIMQLILIIIMMGYFSYKSSFYLITTKAFILEIIILCQYKLETKCKFIKDMNMNIWAFIITILCFGPYSILNLGLWFSIILSFSINNFVYINKYHHNHLWKYVTFQIFIYLVSICILVFFNNNLLIFNLLWMLILFPVWISFSILLILSTLCHLQFFLESDITFVVEKCMNLIKFYNVDIVITWKIEPILLSLLILFIYLMKRSQNFI